MFSIENAFEEREEGNEILEYWNTGVMESLSVGGNLRELLSITPALQYSNTPISLWVLSTLFSFSNQTINIGLQGCHGVSFELFQFLDREV